MTNVDSILKSKDITLPAKVHLVKAMAFSVVVSGLKDLTGQFFAEVQTFGKQGQEKELSQGDMIISLDLKSVSSLPC